MKTYTRKPQVHEAIEGIEDLCRLCLGKSESVVPIFRKDVKCCLASRIMLCVGFEVIEDECLPNHICMDCFNDLQKCYAFRVKCELAYQKLKHHLLAVPFKSRERNLPLNLLMEPELTDPDPEDSKLVVEENVSDIMCNKHSMNEDHKNEESVTKVDVNASEELTAVMSLLIALGVLAPDGDGLTRTEDESVVEVETADGVMMMEFVEEDDEEENNQETENSETDKILIESVTASLDDDKSGGAAARAWCGVCLRSFSSRAALARHGRAHGGPGGGARPHACPVCRRRFAQREVARRHMLVHAEERPFRCSSCPKSFTQRGALAAHARSHARALALHCCRRCDKVFLHASGLSRHMMSHNGRVFGCETCHKQFKDKSSLQRHRRTMHHEPADPAPDHSTGLMVE